MKNSTAKNYYNIINITEKLHRLFLNLLNTDLDKLGVHDINSVQALILYNIAYKEISVGDLTDRGYYQGSNSSYNIKNMIQNGYIDNWQNVVDKRMVSLKLTKKGINLYKQIEKIFEERYKMISEDEIDYDRLMVFINNLGYIDRININND